MPVLPEQLLPCWAFGAQVTVSVSPDAVSGALTSDAPGLSLSSLLPGALVSAKVRRVLSDGLLVSFATFFHGSIDAGHSGAPIPLPDWKKAHKEGQKVRARCAGVGGGGGGKTKGHPHLHILSPSVAVSWPLGARGIVRLGAAAAGAAGCFQPQPPCPSPVRRRVPSWWGGVPS